MSQIIPSLFIDARKLGDGGIGTFIRLLVDGLLELASDSLYDIKTVRILMTSDFRKRYSDNVSRWEQAGCVVYEDNTPKYSIRELFLLPLRWRRALSECDWYISPHYTLPFFIPCRALVVLHDVIHIQYPENILHTLFAPLLIRTSLKRADKVATVSEHCIAAIRKSFPDISTIPLSVIPNASTLEALSIKKDVNDEKKINILAIGADRPHKNFSMLVRFLSELKKNKYSYKAILVTKLSHCTSELIKEFELDSNIEIHTNISDLEIESLYREADCFITTSKAEGFCIPLLDAMRSKVPVMCPDVAFARCLAGEAGWYFNSHCVDDFMRQYLCILSDVELRNKKIEVGYQTSLEYTPLAQAKALVKIISSS
jgi:glycosyltransferase involved in cell wall biosynthesis